jgi:hypothetical protein
LPTLLAIFAGLSRNQSKDPAISINWRL